MKRNNKSINRQNKIKEKKTTFHFLFFVQSNLVVSNAIEVFEKKT